MSATRKIGLEAEFLLMDDTGCIVVPPSWWPRDDYPLLAELQATPASTMHEVVANFYREQLHRHSTLEEGQTMHFMTRAEVPLCLYREVNRQIAGRKKLSMVKNIYGVEIEEYSDQIIKAGKIQGLYVSCGLHIHFSLDVEQVTTINKYNYHPVTLPLTVGNKSGGFDVTTTLYTRGPQEEQVLKAKVSKLNRPTIEWIIRKMDEKFFERFAPAKAERTKYRQPGFYEIKPYGFEYRSLPANSETIAALPEIVTYCFSLLDEANS